MGNTGSGHRALAVCAPQVMLQSNHQVKYDGSKTLGSHISSATVSTSTVSLLLALRRLTALRRPCSRMLVPRRKKFAHETGPFPGGDTNPLNYPVEFVSVGNGLGYLTADSGVRPSGRQLLYTTASPHTWGPVRNGKGISLDLWPALLA